MVLDDRQYVEASAPDLLCLSLSAEPCRVLRTGFSGRIIYHWIPTVSLRFDYVCSRADSSIFVCKPLLELSLRVSVSWTQVRGGGGAIKREYSSCAGVPAVFFRRFCLERRLVVSQCCGPCYLRSPHGLFMCVCLGAHTDGNMRVSLLKVCSLANNNRSIGINVTVF